MAAAMMALFTLGSVAVAPPSSAVNTGPPVVTKVAPAKGGIGTKVVVTGTDFYKPTAVSFGGVPATSFSASPTGTTLTVYSPTTTVAGAVDIIVTTSFGPSATSSADQFTYLAPTIALITPSKGTYLGGTTVTIEGAALGGTEAVMFGANAAARFVVVSTTKITAVTPAYTPNATSCCSADVTVTTPLGTNPVTSAAVFHYGSWPTQLYQGNLLGVSCGGASECVAAGDDQNKVGKRSLYEQSSGSSFTAMAGSGLAYAVPRSVSCPTTDPTSCVAVGADKSTALIEHDTATGWATEAVPLPARTAVAALDGVSCTADGFCMAVGYAGASLVTAKPLTEVLDPPASWAIVPSLVYGTVSVSCTSSEYCVGVGGYPSAAVGAGDIPASEVWNGTSWTADAPVDPTANSYLSSISCTGPGQCVAVGANGPCTLSCGTAYSPLIEQLSGTTWSEMSAPTFAGQLVSVSCSDASDCMAIGQSSGGDPVIESWDGTSWTTEAAATPTGATTTELEGVSCTAPSDCVAVGQWTQQIVETIGVTYDTLYHTLAEVWDGSGWTVVPSADS